MIFIAILIDEFNDATMRCYRKWLTRITIAAFFLSGGIEYSVILPTCWDYMNTRFHSENWFYGLTLSAMSISNLLIGPIMGALYDRTHRTKILVIILNIFEITGNFMYFAATSKYMVLGSRFLVGIGVSAGSVLFGELARTTTKKERTAVFSLFMATRQIGLVIGPAFNLFLRICNFNLGPFTVDKFTSPALFMMVVWLVIEVMFLLVFFQLPPVAEKEEKEEKEAKKKNTMTTTSDQNNLDTLDKRISNSYIQESTQDMFVSNSTTSLPQNENTSLLESTKEDNKGVEDIVTTKTQYGSINPVKEVKSSKEGVVKRIRIVLASKSQKFYGMILQLLREETVLLLAMLFFTILNHLILETGLVPYVETMLNWNEFGTSLFFSGAGVVVICSFIIVSILSRKISDRYLIIVGLCFHLFAYIWMVSTLGNAKKTRWTLEEFLFGAFMVIIGLPFFIVSSASLYSKLLPVNIQGFGQGVRRSVASLSAIMGPLWAGAAFEMLPDFKFYPFYGVPLLLMVLILIMMLLSFNKLKEPSYMKRPEVSNLSKS